MNRLNELIQKLCPNGVEFHKIKDVYTRLKGTPITASKMKEIANEAGDIRIFAGGKTVIDAFEEDIPNANITRVPAVLVQSRGVIDAVYYDKPFTFKNEMWAYTADTVTEVKYLYYVLKNNINTFREAASGMGSLPQISLKVTEEFVLAVPPLEVQREIVRILDSFTLLTAELTAELTARKSQYEFYRDDLLTFSNEVEFKSFGELFDVRNGLNKGKEFFGHGSPIINFTDVYNNRWLAKDSFAGTVEVTPDEIERYGAKKGDIFFTRTSETKEDIGMASTLIEDVEDCVFSGFVLRARPKTDLLLPKFCAYYFSSTTVRNTIVRYASFTTRATTTGEKLSKILVPILPKDKQEKIVYVLDNFDAICSDLNIGLPAEIEARQKQYKYYRDALLTYAATGKIIRQTDRQTDRQLSVLR